MEMRKLVGHKRLERNELIKISTDGRCQKFGSVRYVSIFLFIFVEMSQEACVNDKKEMRSAARHNLIKCYAELVKIILLKKENGRGALSVFRMSLNMPYQR